ncbi:MAG: hypothetical protein A3J37_04780 [Alphaproteobacteria bacterium RIFCSPHIGHO2_12_FULL_45_9]|nr:MAG: hypothetical protein A3B66_09890 [Alphaproteobacteria bacterium RIFCSPHIGHO2_02_FULL_46_13]OFW97543.1 MAG: hypothetical protein A3J37_04780 [Alphaproteobacteria bacterium RIFCSPHIGHO2_12_FULL_45_9]
MAFEKAEIVKIQDYLQKKFGNPGITLRDRKVEDSMEVLINGEFIAVIYKDVDEGETSYDLNMSILDIDVDGE